MLVLTRANSSRETANLEMQLLRLFGSAMECANNSAGGESASAGSPHYFYVLVGHSDSALLLAPLVPISPRLRIGREGRASARIGREGRGSAL